MMPKVMEVMLPIKDMVPILTQVIDMETTTCSLTRETQTSNITIGMFLVIMVSHLLIDLTRQDKTSLDHSLKH
jgi:hypothetical protein